MLARGVTPVIPVQGSVGASRATSRRSPTWPPSSSARARPSTPAAACPAPRRSPPPASPRSRSPPRRASPSSTAPSSPPPSRSPRLFDAWRAAQSGAPRLRALHRRHHGLDRAAPARDPRAARPPRPDRGRRRRCARIMAGSEIRESHRTERHPRPGSLLHPLPAAGDRRRDGCPALRPPPPSRIEANAATDNPLVLEPTPSSPAATSTPSRWPSPPT